MREPIVVVGAGQAAAQAVVSLRSAGHDGDIVVFGAEPHPPYQRPPLSKKRLAGALDDASLHLKGPTFWAEAGVDLRLSTQVEEIDPARRRVVVGSMKIGWDRLLIATGSVALALPIPGLGLDGVFTLRTLADVARIRPLLTPGARLVVVGGGYVGLEVAATARGLGLDVTVLEAAPRVLARVVAPVVSRFFEGLHARHGVQILTQSKVAAIEGRERVSAVRLADGRRFVADLVLVAAGGAPDDSLARAAGLATDEGIVVDESAATSAPGVFAAGDVARFPSRRYGRRLRLESVQNAIDQAKVAAQAMLGLPAAYDPVPWFWSDQYEHKLQIVGLAEGHDALEIEGDPVHGPFAVTCRREGRLLAVETVDMPRRHMEARRALADTATGVREPIG